jgi:hypothetical protein
VRLCRLPAAPNASEELCLVGGETTREARELARAAVAAGLTARWLPFASAKGQAALAAQGPSAIGLPLVIIGDRYSRQCPVFPAVSACLAAVGSGEEVLPDGVTVLGDGPRAL